MFDSVLATVRGSGANGLEVATQAARNGLVNVKKWNVTGPARSALSKGWQRFKPSQGHVAGNAPAAAAVGETSPAQAMVQYEPDANGPDANGHDNGEHDNEGSSAFGPTAIIVAGLATLCIVAVLTTGPVDDVTNPESTKVALATLPATVQAPSSSGETKAIVKQTAAAPVPAAPPKVKLDPVKPVQSEPQQIKTATLKAEPIKPAVAEAPAKALSATAETKPIQLAAVVSPAQLELGSAPPAPGAKQNSAKSGEQPLNDVQQIKPVKFSADEKRLIPPAPAVNKSVVTPPTQPAHRDPAEVKQAVADPSKPQVKAVARSQAPADEATVQLQMLRGENERLKEMMAELESETLDLNSELLQLELTLADDREVPRQVVETRTVYNFVNVPLGGDVDSGNSAQYDVNANNSYGGNPDPNNQQYIDNGQGYNNDPALIANMPAPEMGWSPEGQLIAPTPNHQLYQDDANYVNVGADPYFDQGDYIREPGYGGETGELMYGDGADIQYGPAPPPVDLRTYPPVNNSLN